MIIPALNDHNSVNANPKTNLTPQVQSQEIPMLPTSLTNNSGPIFSHGIISNKEAKIIWDSGAGISILSNKYTTNLPIISKSANITGISGNSSQTIGSVSLGFTIESIHFFHTFQVYPNSPVDCLLGNDFFVKVQPIIDYFKSWIMIPNDIIIPFHHLASISPPTTSITMQSDVDKTEKKNEEDIQEMKEPKIKPIEFRYASDSDSEDDSSDTEEDEDISTIFTLPVIIEPASAYANPISAKAVKFKEYGQAYAENGKSQDFLVATITSDSNIEPVSISPKPIEEPYINPTLSLEEKAEILKLVEEFSDVFSTPDKPLQRSKQCQVRIHTTGPPLQSRPYPLAIQQRAKLREELDRMLKLDVIQPSSSAWSSPIVMVPKPDGTIRFCCDFKKFNLQLQKDQYPLPMVQDIIDQLGGNRYFTALDLTSAFWQLNIHPEDRYKTAFTTFYGLYEWKSLPFGISIASASFQRWMEVVFKEEISSSKIVVYIDDIICMSKTFEEHIQNLRQVFNKLKDASLTLSKKKCNFAMHEITVLGFLLNEEGYRPSPKNVEAIKRLPPPKCLKELQRFLGLAGFYRRMIKQYSQLVKPLTDLLQKDVKFIFGPEQKKIYEKLKQLITSYPILAHFEFGLPTIVHTDASTEALGGILLQVRKGREHPVIYESRKLTRAESKWTITEIEMLGLCFALAKFRKFILNTKFSVRTDHKALVYLRNFKEQLSPKLTRMAIKISEFGDFPIIFRPGKLMTDVDALSRLPARDPTIEDEELLKLPTLCILYISPQEFNTSQSTDSFSLRIKDLLTDPTITKKPKRFAIINELIYYLPQRNPLNPVIVLPSKLVKPILEEFHSTPYGGHQGVKKTKYKIQQKYYFPKMNLKIQKFVNSCFLCQTRKKPPLKPAGLLQSIEPTSIFHTVGLDFAGPFPVTPSGNKYILLAVDLYSKWLETKAVEKATSTIVANFLLELISRHGFISTLISDRGSQMTSHLLRDTLASLKISHNLASTAHHQTNGNTERAIRSLYNILAMFMDQHQSNWADVLPLATFAFNSGPAESTKLYPFLIVYGREPNFPSSFSPEISVPLSQHLLKLQTIRNSTKNNIMESQIHQAIQYNKRRRIVHYKEGDKVMIFKERRKKGLNPKLQRHFYGPFLIKQKLSDLNYKITPLFGPKANISEEIVHVETMKKFEEIENIINIPTTIPISPKPIVPEIPTKQKSLTTNSTITPKIHNYNLRPRK